MTHTHQLPQLALLDRFVEILKSVPQIRAAFLRGSFYRGRPDSYSDLNIFAVAQSAETEHLIALGRAALGQVGHIICVSVLETTPLSLRALFPGPLRVNLTMVTTKTLPPYEGWRILFDHDQLLRTETRPFQTNAPLLAEHVSTVCDEFWWSMFSSVRQLKRGQLWLALHLLDTCRAGLAQMLRWRRDPNQPAERYTDLEQHLTVEDQQALSQTLASYDLRSITEALLSAADAFDPAAREVSARTGAEYPTALAQATKEFYIREFWALIAPGPAISA